MSMQILDSKEKNYYYAPGIATYGIDGRPGKTGEDGSGIFFTTYLFDLPGQIGQEDLKTILSAIVNSKSLIETTKEITLSRKYRDGDYIITKTGKIYQLNNFSLIDLSKFESSVVLSDDEYKNYFELIGVIDLSPQQDVEINSDGESFTQAPFMLNDKGRVTFRTVNVENNINGFDLSNELLPESDDERSILRIVNSENSDGKYEMISFSVRPNSASATEESNLKIFYDANNQMWNFSSNYPIVLDAPSVMIQQTENTQSNANYAQVLTNEDIVSGTFSLEALCNSASSEIKTTSSSKAELTMTDINNSIMNVFSESLIDNAYFKIEVYKENSDKEVVSSTYFYDVKNCKFKANDDNSKTDIVCETNISMDSTIKNIYAYLVLNTEILITKYY